MMKNICRYILKWGILAVWLVFLIEITLVSRHRESYASYNLKLFWCLEEAWKSKQAGDWFFIVGNILLFIPFGIMAPACIKYMRKTLNIAVTGLCISILIEIIQLVFHMGLFEFDDMFNNTVGTILGYGIFVLFTSIMQNKKTATLAECIFITSVWILTVGFFAFSLSRGQPVFDDFYSGIHGLFDYFIEKYNLKNNIKEI